MPTTKPRRNIFLRFTLIFAFSFFLLTALFALLPNGTDNIYDGMIRLHVLANSDSAEDQSVKLAVRDAVLGYITPLVEDCSDVSEVEQVISENLDGIKTVSQAVLSEISAGADVAALLTRETYPTRDYEGIFSTPAGEYLSLRVLIGEAEGQNWWCVLFPPLCVKAATSSDSVKTEMKKAGFSEDEIKTVMKSGNVKYEVKFKLLEFFDRFKKKK